MKNLGWHFYRNYFNLRSLQRSIHTAQEANQRLSSGQKDSDDVEIETTKKFFNDRNKIQFDEKFTPNELLTAGNSEHIIKLTTTYPGLLSGVGVSHETGKLGELKLGFSFDHTTGLPYLPGSTVKGNLRHVFPFRLRLQASRIKIENAREGETIAQKKKREKKVKEKTDLLEKASAFEIYCIGLFKEKTNITITPKQLFQLEWAVFEGKKIENIDEVFIENSVLFHKIKTSSIPIYESDIFHDACIYDVIDSHTPPKKFFLGNDFITPHKEPLKNPIPVHFLKILPNVTWAFQFDLKNSEIGDVKISASQKLDIFKQILLDLGIGAKTNVGYGRLTPSN